MILSRSPLEDLIDFRIPSYSHKLSMAAVIFSDVVTEDAGLQGTLFKGLKFWLAQRVPQRSRFIADIKVSRVDPVMDM